MPPRASRTSLPPRWWATTCCRLSLCLYTVPLSCSLQPLLMLSLWSLGPSLLSIVSLLLNHGNLIFEPLCVFTFASSTFAFLIEIDSSFKSLFAIWWLSPQWFHYYFYCNIISWQYQKYWTVKEGKKKMFDLRQNATNRATRRFSIGKVRVNTWLILEFWIFESTVARWPCIDWTSTVTAPVCFMLARWARYVVLC